MTAKNLVSTFLHPGDRIRIGRNRAQCELVIPCPNLSGLHCAVEVNKTSESSRPSPFDGSGPPSKCTVLDLSSNGTWLIKGEEDVAGPKRMKKGVTVDFCPGDCIMLLAPQHKLSRQHRFVLQHSSAVKGEAGSAEFVLVQLPWEGGVDSSTVIAEKLPRRKPSGSGKVDSKSDDLGDHMIAKDGPSTRKRKSFCTPAGGELDTSRDSLNLKKSRLEATGSSNDHASINVAEMEVAIGVRRKLTTGDDSNTSCDESTSHGEEEQNNRVPPDGTAPPPEVESTVLRAPSHPAFPAEISVEQCPCCLKLFPVLELMAHAEVCMHESSVDIDGMRVDVTVSKPSISRESEAESVVSGPVVASTHSSLAPPSMPSEVSTEKCPSCLKLFPLCELVEHCQLCRSRIETVREEEVRAPGPMDADNSSRYNLESCTDFATATRVSRNGTSSMLGKKEKLPSPVSSQVGAAACGTSGELEQCLYCLQDFPVSELIHHVESCPARDDARSKVSRLR